MIHRIPHSVPITLVAATTFLSSACARQSARSEPNSGPRVECPASVSLGECVYGSDKRAEFTVRNSGTQDLVLDNFQVSCTCSSLTVRGPDGSSDLTRVTLPPRAEAAIGVTVTVRSRFNDAARTRITFRTNDPSATDVSVEVAASRVIGGFTPLPGACNFGTVGVGTECRQMVHLVDEAVAPRPVAAVVSSNPARVRVTFSPSAGKDRPADVTNPGYYLGTITVAIDTTTPGSVDERVAVEYRDPGPRTEVIPVSATVVPKLSVLPATLTLPRAEPGGGRSYTGIVWLRAQGRLDRSTIKLIGSPFARVSAEAGDSPLVPVRLTVDPATLPPAGKGEGKYAVEFTAVVDGEERHTTLTVAMNPR